MSDQPLPASLVRYRQQLQSAIERDIRDSKRRRRRRVRPKTKLLPPLAGAAATAVAVIVLLAGGSGSGSIVDRAYAAVDGDGAIVHFVETARPAPDPGGLVATAQVWIAGTRARAIVTVRRPSGLPSGRVTRRQIIVNGRHVTSIMNGRRIQTTGQACAPLLGFCDGAIGSPFASLGSLYKSGRLRQAASQTVDGQRVDVIVGEIPWTGEIPNTGPHNRRRSLTIRILVNPTTAIPVKITETFAPGSAITATVSDYRKLPFTPHNAQLLSPRP